METKRNLLTYSKPLSLLILILFLVTAVKVNATNYYIAANGDDLSLIHISEPTRPY